MDGMIYFLHPCARLSAEWLTDPHTKTQLFETGKLLSAAIAMNTLDGESYYRFQKSHLTHPLMPWLLESSLHAQWLLSHFCALADKQRRLFVPGFRSFREERAFALVVNATFPDAPWQNPPVLTPPEYARETPDASYRAYYLHAHVRLGMYRRSTMPIWVRRYLDDTADLTF